MRTLKQSDINHLRRLIGYVRCEIGEDEQATIHRYENLVGIIKPEHDEEAKQRIMKSIEMAASVPQYVRRAITALEKVVNDSGDIVDVEYSGQKAIGINKHLMDKK